uniref:Tetratricopeptide repeat protein n=1 Tax=Geobacter sp. (strain M21) TaxID=443144 RepID=C6E9H4_GEOSM
MEKVKTVAVNVAAIALISLVLIWGNTLYRQHAQFEKGEQASASGNFTAAVAGYEAAIHMYTPWSSVVEKSAQKLWAIGEAAERSSDIPRALIAYRALRSSFHAAAGIYAPGEDWIKRCDTRIAQLVQLQPAQR